MTTDLGGTDDQATSVALQTDGKIVAAGYSENGSDEVFAVLRYATDGSLDPTFGTGGKVTTDLGGVYDEGLDVAVQGDGKIVVAGYSYTGSNGDFALVRYAADGSLDPSFGTGGKVITDIGGAADIGSDVAVQSDGKIVLAGYSYTGSNYDFAVVRYLGDTMPQQPTDTPTATPISTATLTPADTTTNTPTPTVTPTDTPTITPTPTPECGNGIVETGEVCDDGNTVDGDCCSADCMLIYEKQACSNCTDAIDNDGDDTTDCHDSGCSLIAPLFDYAGLATSDRKSYLGGQVQLLDQACMAASHCSSGDTSGVAGLCGRRFDIRRGSKIGVFSVVDGLVLFGNSGDPAADAQAIDIRCSYATDASTTESDRTSAAVVGPGTCSNDPLQACLIVADCGGAGCDRKRIDDGTNAYVNRLAAAPEYSQCDAAINQLVTTGQAISALAGIDVSTLPLACCTDSTFASCATPYISSRNSLVTKSSCPYLRVTLASGAQVINVGTVKVAGVTELRLVGEASTVAVMNVGKLSSGGRARVDFKDAAGNDLDPARLLWNLKGSGAPASLRGNTVFAGTIFAAERSGGIKTGASVVVRGALLGQKLKLLANTQICHAPFCAVAP